MKRITYVFILLVTIYIQSCNNNTSLNRNMTFTEVEQIFGMKQPFSETSKSSILARYTTVENYYNFVIERKKKLNNSKKVSQKNQGGYLVTLNTPDGTVSFHCHFDQYILDKAEEEGINLPYSDRVGASSTCAGQIKKGIVDQSEQSFLDDDQITQGYVLLCVAYPASDVEIDTHKNI